MSNNSLKYRFDIVFEFLSNLAAAKYNNCSTGSLKTISPKRPFTLTHSFR